MEYFYLDASPMIRALRQSPSEFELCYKHIRHKPSCHWLAFDPCGTAVLCGRCNAASFPITREQTAQLRSAVATWLETYWRPLMTRQTAARQVAENRAGRGIARHLRPKSRWRRAMAVALTWLEGGPSQPHDRVARSHLRVVSPQPTNMDHAVDRRTGRDRPWK